MRRRDVVRFVGTLEKFWNKGFPSKGNVQAGSERFHPFRLTHDAGYRDLFEVDPDHDWNRTGRSFSSTAKKIMSEMFSAFTAEAVHEAVFGGCQSMIDVPDDPI